MVGRRRGGRRQERGRGGKGNGGGAKGEGGEEIEGEGRRGGEGRVGGSVSDSTSKRLANYPSESGASLTFPSRPILTLIDPLRRAHYPRSSGSGACVIKFG